MQMPPQPLGSEDYSLKDTWPHLGGDVIAGDKVSSSYDLVEQMHYLYVRVVKGKDLHVQDASGCYYAEVKLGNYKGITRHAHDAAHPVWNNVFAFSKQHVQGWHVEVAVREGPGPDALVGTVMFDLNDVPRRAPPDSPLAPQWYRLEDRTERRARGEVMLALWMGTQADEAFPEASHSDAATVPRDRASIIRSKVYLSPKLWYLRVNVIGAQDLIPSDNSRVPEAYVRAKLGSQIARTRISPSQTVDPIWNEDLIFVAAEPFEEHLILSVEDRIAADNEEVLGKAAVVLHGVDRRLHQKPVNSRWYSLWKPERPECRSRIHVRICLEGGYHVFDESSHFSSDLRATSKQLWRPSIGILELGILTAHGLIPMKTKDGRGTTDAYCVAKYGPKWVRTRTVVGSFSPRWNEQYTWEVYDPCTTVTVGMFDNCLLIGEDADDQRDASIGKVRIRLSTLEAGRVYTHAYPLVVLAPTGAKKMGEVQLAVRFTCSSLLNMMQLYSRQLLPKMHYLHPLSVVQLSSLRHQAIEVVSARLGRAEPPLRKEVIECMLDVDLHLWSVRKSRANFYRIVAVLRPLGVVCNWFHQICQWSNPATTVVIHVMFVVLVVYPWLILPSVFLNLFFLAVWQFRWRPRRPPHMDVRLSHADTARPDELDEEFDTLPASRPPEIVQVRYDRLRSIAGRAQVLLGDVAAQGERVQSLFSWRDPRATAIFVAFCLLAAIVFYATPTRMLGVVAVLYLLRHPRFRGDLRPAPLNFFRRLPERTDCVL